MLTKKQRDLLVYIHDHMTDDDIAPSFDEMREALGLKSKSGIHRLITGLEERGYIERLPHRARAIAIKRLPEKFEQRREEKLRAASEEINPAVTAAAGGAGAPPQNTNFIDLPGHVESIPLCGKISAGTPIEAIRHEGDSIQIPPGFAGTGELYALTIDGDSMINAGIFDLDTVIIKRCDTAENGAIVVALVDGEDVTLKRLKREGGKIVLYPENNNYEPQVYDPARVQIQGKLVSLMRSYH